MNETIKDNMFLLWVYWKRHYRWFTEQ